MIIRGEQASEIQDLPESWRNFADLPTGLSDSSKSKYIEMAQLFQYKLNNFNLEIEGEDDLYKECFSKVFAILCKETLDFYASDFLLENYPNFDSLYNEIYYKSYLLYDEEAYAMRQILYIGKDLFEEFGYKLPASFYWCYLSPTKGENFDKILPISDKSTKNYRAWNAILNSPISAIQMRIQAISSQRGFVWLNGFNQDLSRIDTLNKPFEFSLSLGMREVWLQDYIWSIWTDYALSGLYPVIKLTNKLSVSFISFA